MVSLTLKPNADTANLCLGFLEITLLFNAGPFPGGGDCLFVNADGEVLAINSNDLIADLDIVRATASGIPWNQLYRAWQLERR